MGNMSWQKALTLRNLSAQLTGKTQAQRKQEKQRRKNARLELPAPQSGKDL